MYPSGELCHMGNPFFIHSRGQEGTGGAERCGDLCRGRGVWMHTGAAPRQEPAGVGRLGADEPGEGARPSADTLPQEPSLSPKSLGTGPRRTVPVERLAGTAVVPLASVPFLQRVLGKGRRVMQRTHPV